MRTSKMLQQMTPLIAVCAVIFSLAGGLRAADKTKAGSEPGAKRYERSTDPSLYVGAETCKTCHEDIFKNFETTPHVVTLVTLSMRYAF
jgi:hypothetical protein